MKQGTIEIEKRNILITDEIWDKRHGGCVNTWFQVVKHVLLDETRPEQKTGMQIYALDIGRVFNDQVRQSGKYSSTTYNADRVIGPSLPGRATLADIEPLLENRDKRRKVKVGKTVRRLGTLEDLPEQLRPRAQELLKFNIF